MTGEQLMTNQHPLTDEICKKIAESKVLWHPDWPVLDSHEKTYMRAAYDLGRDELLAWLDKNLENYTDAPDHWGGGRHIDYLIKDLVRAMRPQQQQEKN
jgi:hypothetical protein